MFQISNVRMFFIFSCAALALAVTSCNAPSTTDTKPEAAKPAMAAATASDYEIAPQEYATLAEAALQKTAAQDYDGLAAMLSDDVEFYYPDGDQNTRTKFIGKQALMTWLKNSVKSAGAQPSTFTAFNTIPLKVNKKMNAGALNGYQVICFFTGASTYNNGNAVSVRRNAVLHFNDSKLIDRIYNYYDRTPFIKAAGKNILDAAKK